MTQTKRPPRNSGRFTTRYDKTKRSYLGFVTIVAVNYGYPLSTKPIQS